MNRFGVEIQLFGGPLVLYEARGVWVHQELSTLWNCAELQRERNLDAKDVIEQHVQEIDMLAQAVPVVVWY